MDIRVKLAAGGVVAAGIGLGAGYLALRSALTPDDAKWPEGNDRWKVKVDPPGWFNAYPARGATTADGAFSGKLDPPGWDNAVRFDGKPQGDAVALELDPGGLFNDVRIALQRDASGEWRGSFDVAGPFDAVTMRFTDDGTSMNGTVDSKWDKVDGTRISGHGNGDGFEIEIDPKGFRNTTKLKIDGPSNVGVRAAIVAAQVVSDAQRQARRDAGTTESLRPSGQAAPGTTRATTLS